MRCHHDDDYDKSDFEVRKTADSDLWEPLGRDSLVMGRPMGCHNGYHTDQSDFEVRKTPNLDLRMTKTYHGQLWAGE